MCWAAPYRDITTTRPERYAAPDGQPNGDSHRHTYTVPDSHTHPDTHTHGDRHAHIHPNCHTDPDPTARTCLARVDELPTPEL